MTKWLVFLHRLGILTLLTFLGAMTDTVKIAFSMLPKSPEGQVPRSSFLWQVQNIQPTTLPLPQQKIKTGHLSRHHP